MRENEKETVVFPDNPDPLSSWKAIALTGTALMSLFFLRNGYDYAGLIFLGCLIAGLIMFLKAKLEDEA